MSDAAALILPLHFITVLNPGILRFLRGSPDPLVITGLFPGCQGRSPGIRTRAALHGNTKDKLQESISVQV